MDDQRTTGVNLREPGRGLAAELGARVDVDRLTGHLVEMVRIPSVNPMGRAPGVEEGEAAVAEYLGDHLSAIGLEVESRDVAPGRPNLWATRPGGDGPTLALVGHLDTVGVEGYDEPFSGAVRAGRVHGRGACDMKAALAAFIEVATLLADVELGGNIVIAGLADEEYGMIGSRDDPRSRPRIDHAIIGEPTSLDVCTAHLGQYGFVITTHGRAVHSSIPQQGVNAIEKMAAVIRALGDHREEIRTRPAHDLCGTGTLSPGVIRGGELAAIVPDRCELELDRRITPLEDGRGVVEDLRRLLDELAADDPELDYEISEPTWDIGSLDTPRDSPIVQATCAAAAELGLSSRPRAFPAATDGPNLAVPAVVCGPGALARAHTLDEWVEIDEVVRATKLYLHAIAELLA